MFKFHRIIIGSCFLEFLGNARERRIMVEVDFDLGISWEEESGPMLCPRQQSGSWGGPGA